MPLTGWVTHCDKRTSGSTSQPSSSIDLRVWFSAYLLNHGEVEANMLRDAFPHVMDEFLPNQDMRDHH